MKIKIPNFKTIKLSDYDYFLSNKEIYVFNKHTKRRETYLGGSKRGEYVVLPTNTQRHLLFINIELKNSVTGSGKWILINDDKK